MRTEVALTRTAARDGTAVLSEAEFEVFYRRTARSLWAYLQRMTGDAAAADDLTQKAFLQLLRTPLDGTEESRIRGLLYRTATNQAIDHIRRVRRERQGWLGLRQTDRRTESAELRHDMGRAFRRLTPRERSLLWLAHVEGFDHREIAAIAGVAPGSVRVLLFRARRKLGDTLRSLGLGPEVIS
ncbi:MAG TPA: sigma-70 family RNA polymerase sigma factor [Thermoanaerobaculia bacterium]|nr:sigma-70 family RNA polymerase sigma factor [Thermoanaerobaculia bacterium]